jgi:hypothetical protein
LLTAIFRNKLQPEGAMQKCVGRDYDSVLKTKLGVVIEDDRELARKRLQQIIKVPEEQVDEFAIYGTPEDVLRQKKKYLKEIQYLIVDLDLSKELEALNNLKGDY